MANVIKLHKGLDINLKGKPAEELLEVKIPETYALVPDDFHGIIPKVVVKEQDYVKAGDTLFVDKKHPEVKFVSLILIAWFFNPEKLRQEANEFSNFSIGRWWVYSLKIITTGISDFGHY